MMKRIEFTVPGPPVGKARPRVMKTGHTYTPQQTILYENLVKTMYIQAGGQLTQEPVDMNIAIYYPIPKSTTKKKLQAIENNEIRPMKKPDIDNCIKIIADSLNGVAYKDDTQIIRVTAEKHYSTEPRVEVVIKEWYL